MSLRWRCAPAYGSEVVSFRSVYPALFPKLASSPRKRPGLDCVAPSALRAWVALKLIVRWQLLETRHAVGMPRLYIRFIA